MTTLYSTSNSVLTGGAVRALMADSDKEEHFLMSVMGSIWAPHINFDFAVDGAEMLLKLAFTDSVHELPSIIILNRYMDKYDGLRTLCELQAHPVLWQIPVVVVVDDFDIRSEIDCYRSGACWVQPKAQDIDEMRDFLACVEGFAASPAEYDSSGLWDLTLLTEQYVSEIERYRDELARSRKL